MRHPRKKFSPICLASFMIETNSKPTLNNQLSSQSSSLKMAPRSISVLRLLALLVFLTNSMQLHECMRSLGFEDSREKAVKAYKKLVVNNESLPKKEVYKLLNTLKEFPGEFIKDFQLSCDYGELARYNTPSEDRCFNLPRMKNHVRESESFNTAFHDYLEDAFNRQWEVCESLVKRIGTQFQNESPDEWKLIKELDEKAMKRKVSEEKSNENDLLIRFAFGDMVDDRPELLSAHRVEKELLFNRLLRACKAFTDVGVLGTMGDVSENFKDSELREWLRYVRICDHLEHS